MVVAGVCKCFPRCLNALKLFLVSPTIRGCWAGRNKAKAVSEKQTSEGKPRSFLVQITVFRELHLVQPRVRTFLDHRGLCEILPLPLSSTFTARFCENGQFLIG